MMMDNLSMYEDQIKEELTKDLEQQIIQHRLRFMRIFKARYMEMLSSLIHYKNANQLAVDFFKVETALRSGYDVVIGETTARNIQLIGYTKSKQTQTDPANLFESRKLRHGDIQFVIQKHLKCKYYKEITYEDSCETGNFVVLRNKNLNFVSDLEVLDHYIEELSEIVVSRYSISMQVKILTLFLSDGNDDDMNKLISSIYRGSPFLKGATNFDPDDQIVNIKNDGIAQNFQELKREYQNKISELNNTMGIQSLAVEKSSGVSDTEAKSNRAFTTSVSNIFLDGRNPGLIKLNKRYKLKNAIVAQYNDQVESEYSDLLLLEDLNKEGGSNGDTV